MKSVEESVEAIFRKADQWESEGKDVLISFWQTILEIMLLVVRELVSKNPGKVVPMEIGNDEEWEFFLDIKKKLDLPPETFAVLVTPTAFKNMPFLDDPEIEDFGLKAWERNAYSLLVSGINDRSRILQAALPGIEHPGIDVFEDGNQPASYSYNTIDECVDDLSKTIWIYFNPEGTWTDNLIVRYTENWAIKGVDVDLSNSPIHQEFSYLHHPELLGFSPFEAVFKAVGVMMREEFIDLETIVDDGNIVNEDFELDQPVVTIDGILNGKQDECGALLEYVKMQMDVMLEILDNVDGVKVPLENRTGPEYRRLFDETALGVYDAVVGKPFSNHNQRP
jgi:hypothetical protein